MHHCLFCFKVILQKCKISSFRGSCVVLLAERDVLRRGGDHLHQGSERALEGLPEGEGGPPGAPLPRPQGHRARGLHQLRPLLHPLLRLADAASGLLHHPLRPLQASSAFMFTMTRSRHSIGGTAPGHVTSMLFHISQGRDASLDFSRLKI